jgi:hypothetical protein
MNFLAEGEKIYASFGTSRKYPTVLKFFLEGIFFFIISAVLFLNVFDILSIIPEFPGSQFLPYLPLLPGIFLILIGESRRKKMGNYYVTNYRIVLMKGFFGTKMESLSYSMIVNVKISQSFKEKLFGLGDLDISTARGTQEMYMTGIPNPKKIENIIYRMLESHSGAERAPQRQYQRKPQYRPQYRKPQYRRPQQRQQQRQPYRRR